MKISFRQSISILFLITLLLVPATSMTVNSAGADASVKNYDELLAAIGTAPAGAAYIIEITDNITLPAQLTIPSGKKITLTSDMTQSGSPFALTQTATTTSAISGARHFSLKSGTTLTLENVVLSGIGVISNFNGGVYVGSNAGLIMNDGAMIRDCRGGTGGGVYVDYFGACTINGGEISGNTASSDGGGIYLNYSTLTMSGGKISNNKALSDTAGQSTHGGGMYALLSTVTITAGEISGNEAMSSAAGTNSYGGGVCLNASTFNMGTTGGSNDSVLIINNTADYMGGGVFAHDALFTMYCGTISNNKALSGNELTYGGGVELYHNSTFTMKDGIISTNISNDFSGGVEVYDGSTFNMDGGSVINNTTPRGGGISVGYNSAAFKMNGGEISGNTAADNGGGVYVYSDGIMTATAGMISGNNAPYGGGIFTDDTGAVNMDNCTIGDNAATASDSGGGGIYTADETYANLTTGDSTVFGGNSAATAYTPTGDLDAEYPNIRYAAVTAPFTHPLNNYDINTTFSSALECHITFDSQGGTGVPDQFKNFGETVDRPIDPVRPGYTFYGWWTKDENGEWDYKWDFGTVLELETHGTELVLYARWDEPTITVSGIVSGLPDNSGITIIYSTDGGATTNSTVTDDSGSYSFTAAYGSDVMIAPPALPEYNVNPESITIENLSEDSANNDFTYTPLNAYTVTYDPNGGDGTAYDAAEAAGTDHIVLDNTDANLGFTKSNYKFTGWNTQSGGNGTAYAPGDTLAALAVDETVTLYAMWQEEPGEPGTTTPGTKNPGGGVSSGNKPDDSIAPDTDGKPDEGTSPRTADSSNLILWFATALSALLIIAIRWRAAAK